MEWQTRITSPCPSGFLRIESLFKLQSRLQRAPSLFWVTPLCQRCCSGLCDGIILPALVFVKGGDKAEPDIMEEGRKPDQRQDVESNVQEQLLKV